MKSSKYLYDRDTLAGLKNRPYQEVLEIKINLAKALLTRLTRDEDMKDDIRITEVKKAIEFNKKLLEELR